MNADGTDQRGAREHSGWSGTWSPDAEPIAHQSRVQGTWDIYLMNAAGSGIRRLTDA